jgi:asparaginyl-tRNA synthetase
MGKGVYTLNPSFRAEKSTTRRHMGVFTHFELESKLITTIDELMNLEEDLVKYIINQTLKECKEELESLNSFVSKGIILRLESLVKDDFGRVSYTQAIELAKTHKEEIKKLYGLDEEVEWGMDLGNSIERYISEVIFKRPVFIHSYPKTLKSFYMKQNENEEVGHETVQAVDLICNGVGEIIGSSIREENYEKLLTVMSERKMNLEPLQWYTDLRKNGGMRTGGLGLGLQRVIQILCYMDSNIRDVTPFPTCFRELDF